MGGSFRAVGEDIWPGEDICVAVLGLVGNGVRISGPSEDIWVAVLGREVRISGTGGYLLGSFRVGGELVEDIWAG